MPRRLAVVCFSLTLFLAACERDGVGPVPLTPGLHILSGAPATDTAKATGRPLEVQVVDAAGRPVVGGKVRFEAVGRPYEPDPTYTEYGVLVGPVGATEFHYGSSMVATTDAQGLARAGVLFWIVSGPAEVVVSVVGSEQQDTARFMVLPSSPTAVVTAPGDTAVYAGAAFGLRAHTVDGWGNPRTDPVAYHVASGPVSLEPGTGRVRATAIGRAAVVASSGGLADTAWVSIVPPGWIATQEHVSGNGGPVAFWLMQLDGSGADWLAPGLDNAVIQQGISWSPDGRDLVIARGSSVNLVSPGESERPIVEVSGRVSPAARFARDGAWIYFAQEGSQAQLPGLFRVRPDGTDPERIRAEDRESLPAPSHDGRLLAYVSGRSPCGVEVCIRVLDLESGEDLTYGTRDYVSRGQSVAWSPVEDLIALVSGRELIVVRSDGSGRRVLADDVSEIAWLDFSPDGAWLVVSGAPVRLVNVSSGLVLPLGQLSSYGATAWRP